MWNTLSKRELEQRDPLLRKSSQLKLMTAAMTASEARNLQAYRTRDQEQLEVAARLAEEDEQTEAAVPGHVVLVRKRLAGLGGGAVAQSAFEGPSLAVAGRKRKQSLRQPSPGQGGGAQPATTKRARLTSPTAERSSAGSSGRRAHQVTGSSVGAGIGVCGSRSGRGSAASVASAGALTVGVTTAQADDNEAIDFTAISLSDEEELGNGRVDPMWDYRAMQCGTFNKTKHNGVWTSVS